MLYHGFPYPDVRKNHWGLTNDDKGKFPGRTLRVGFSLSGEGESRGPSSSACPVRSFGKLLSLEAPAFKQDRRVSRVASETARTGWPSLSPSAPGVVWPLPRPAQLTSTRGWRLGAPPRPEDPETPARGGSQVARELARKCQNLF